MERLKHIVQINILLGAWLIVAPFIMGYSASTVEMTNDAAVGLVLVACSCWMLAAATGQVGASVFSFSERSGLSQRRSTSIREAVSRVQQ